MKSLLHVLCILAAIGAAEAHGQINSTEPRLGYVYPAGGQRGAVVEVLVAGQRLKGVDAAYISGNGVEAHVVRYVKPLSKEQVREIIRQMSQAKGRAKTTPQNADLPAELKADEPLPMDHPLFQSVEHLGPIEFRKLAERYKKQQFSAQLAELAVVRVVIDAEAPPGHRELRLNTSAGLSNPLRFEVGLLPEVLEEEPNGADSLAYEPLELPVMLNGQILPGDADRFRLRAGQGQRLVIEAHARRLLPYLADAVPGWFQATLTLYGPDGREIAFADDYRFDPDPVLFGTAPEDGVYEVEIRDALHRGREDFVYRISIGEQPFVTWMFPMGGQEGSAVSASIGGWNLVADQLNLETRPGLGTLRFATLAETGRHAPRVVPYAVNRLPECFEAEPNENAAEAHSITLPVIVNGRVARPGDRDMFRFEGHGGQVVVVEVNARRLYSPLDSLVRLLAPSGAVLAWNDDHDEQDTGLLTHHADSYLRTELPDDGEYCVFLADVLGGGGEEYTYRLRVSAPMPDFSLRLTPSSINIPAGLFTPVTVYALRKDGFQGDIEIRMSNSADGFLIDGGRIPHGRDHVRMTLGAPRKPPERPVELQFEGCAVIDGQMETRPVVPAEDMMQAFIYRHLVPSEQTLAYVKSPKRSVPEIRLVSETPLRIPKNGSGIAKFSIGRARNLPAFALELSEPPDGFSIEEVRTTEDGVEVVFADGDALEPGFVDNLIVQVFVESSTKPNVSGAQKKSRSAPRGVLPAIPIEITDPQ